ncbi:MAG: DUF4129 domain-containing protein [Firmicutes bacterium]|nr:DUF4129 domain-containing protein [Bacillota bacterium]
MSKRIFPKAYAALTWYAALSPLYFLPAAVLLPGRLWLAAVLPLPALLLTGLAGLQPAKRRAWALILALLLMAAGCAALFLRTAPLAMLMVLPCAVQMLLFMPAMARPAHREWSIQYLGFGLLLHIGAQFFKSEALFQSVAAPLRWIFVVYLVMVLFSYNRSLLDGTGSARMKTLLGHNRVLLAGFCLLALLLASLKAIGAAVRAAIGWIVTAVSAAMLWVSSLFQQSTNGGAAQDGADPYAIFYEDTEPGTFSKIVEIVLIVVGLLIAAALLFYFCKHLIRLLRRAFHALSDKLRLFRQRISADYVDQSETLLDWGEIKAAAARRLARVRTRLLPTPWEKLPPDRRVRRVYQLLLRRAAAPDPALTAREMLQSGALRLPGEAAPSAAALYDRARYSTHPIPPQEADELRRHAGV